MVRRSVLPNRAHYLVSYGLIEESPEAYYAARPKMC